MLRAVCKSLWAHAGINLVELGFVRLFHSFSSDIAFSSCAWQGVARDDDNHVRGGDTFMEIAPGMEMPCLSNDLLLELAVIHIESWLDKHDRGWATNAYNYAFGNEVSTRHASIVFDSPMTQSRDD